MRVLLPSGLLILVMACAVLWVIRSALLPLQRVARETRALADMVAQGERMQPLAKDGLTLEMREVVRALNGMTARLNATIARERAFAADVAHELRTPLAVLRLQLAEPPPGQVARQLDEEVAALAHLVGQLLRFAQAEEAMASERRPCNLSAIARDVCEELAPSALRRRQELSFVAPDESLIVSGNPTLLAVAVRNLVDNALRVSPVEGLVTVSILAQGLAVEDSGPGVPDAHKPRVFDRLWQADRRRGGAGIGLALVRRVMQLHDGAVTVEHCSDGGARFVLTFVHVQPVCCRMGELAPAVVG